MTALKKTDIYDNTSNVIPFRKRNEVEAYDSIPYESMFEAIFNTPDFEAKFKSYIESKILEVYLSQNIESLDQADSPFDAIYISELRPDRVLRSDIEKILALKNISDKSDDISFNDGWDAE